MATIPLPSLSPQRHKALRNLHPLYKRLSGESVWVFLEELGLDEAQCERFMDAFFRQMDHILSCMQALEEQPQLSVRITGSAETCCARCAACTGHLLRADGDPAYIALLPPFGIGCPLDWSLWTVALLRRWRHLPRSRRKSIPCCAPDWRLIPPEGSSAIGKQFASSPLLPDLIRSEFSAALASFRMS